jgi:hypothetical protein
MVDAEKDMLESEREVSRCHGRVTESLNVKRKACGGRTKKTVAAIARRDLDILEGMNAKSLKRAKAKGLGLRISHWPRALEDEIDRKDSGSHS